MFEDLKGTLMCQRATSSPLTYVANSVIWAMCCETINGALGSQLLRGTTVEAAQTCVAYIDWNDAFGPLLRV